MLRTRSVAMLGAGLVGLAFSLTAPGCDEGSGNTVSTAPKTNATQEAQYKARAAAAEKEGPPKPAAHK